VTGVVVGGLFAVAASLFVFYMLQRVAKQEQKEREERERRQREQNGGPS
jgi:hypothetical protein